MAISFIVSSPTKCPVKTVRNESKKRLIKPKITKLIPIFFIFERNKNNENADIKYAVATMKCEILEIKTI